MKSVDEIKNIFKQAEKMCVSRQLLQRLFVSYAKKLNTTDPVDVVCDLYKEFESEGKTHIANGKKVKHDFTLWLNEKIQAI